MAEPSEARQPLYFPSEQKRQFAPALAPF
jgi:hypothetical protein